MIPRTFHFVFGLKEQTEPFHLVFYLCLESCLQVNRPDALNLYYHYMPYGKYWDLIKDKINLVKIDLPEFVTGFKYSSKDSLCALHRYAHQSDFVRLEKLLEHGGVYADVDTIFVNKIPEHLFSKPFVLGREKHVPWETEGKEVPSLCNAFIMSERGAEFGKIWFQDMYKEFDGSWSRHSTILPGKLSKRHPELIHVEPARTFYKHMWTIEGIRALLEGCDVDNEGVVSFHLWSHLWWSSSRWDFSPFHGGMITEDHVRKVDTTYNLVARRFLPEAN